MSEYLKLVEREFSPNKVILWTINVQNENPQIFLANLLTVYGRSIWLPNREIQIVGKNYTEIPILGKNIDDVQIYERYNNSPEMRALLKTFEAKYRFASSPKQEIKDSYWQPNIKDRVLAAYKARNQERLDNQPVPNPTILLSNEELFALVNEVVRKYK